LKRLIENKLEDIRRLIGSAKPVKDFTEIEDDRLQYILSK